MRKILAVLLTLCMIAVLGACSGNATEKTEDKGNVSKEQAETPADETDEADEAEAGESGKTLVVYFSCTGTTKGVAEKIAKITGADLYEIKAAKEYTDDDRNWHDDNSRTTIEQNDKSARPEIGSDPVSLDGYETIYIGFPIWWGEEPRIMDTFVESCGFDGKTVIPFCTSGGSSIGNSGKNLEENAGSGKWLDGERFDSNTTEDELKTWIGESK